MDMGQVIQQISIMAIPILLAIILHEIAHGWVAGKLGDHTARLMGRLTLNPLAHIDLFGTILIPLMLILSRAGILFGYAKPVPVNFHNLRNPKRDMIWVAAAGPAANFAIALVSALVFRLLLSFNLSQFPWLLPLLEPVALMLRASVQLNLLLAVINLIPIPPADGGRILVGLLPRRQAVAYSRIEPFGMLVLVMIIYFNPLNLFGSIIWPLIGALDHLLLRL